MEFNYNGAVVIKPLQLRVSAFKNYIHNNTALFIKYHN